LYGAWREQNPRTFFVLRPRVLTIPLAGYACLLPLKRAVIDQFVRGEITLHDIREVEPYTPGQLHHLYVIAVCVDPIYRARVKHTYGAQLLLGLFSFLLELAEEGIEIETVTARTYKPDGIRLLKEMGWTHLRSPVPGKHLFEVYVPNSGMPVLARYYDRLTAWKEQH
jgi:hypothetical protein